MKLKLPVTRVAPHAALWRALPVCRVLLALVMLAAVPALRAGEWRVHAGESIAAALKSAKAHDVVSVERGDYDGHLVIDNRRFDRRSHQPSA